MRAADGVGKAARAATDGASAAVRERTDPRCGRTGAGLRLVPGNADQRRSGNADHQPIGRRGDRGLQGWRGFRGVVQRAQVRLAGQPAARKDGAGWPGRRRPGKPHREAAAERHRHLAVDLPQLQPRWRHDSGEARSRRLQNVSKSNGIVCWTSRSGLLTRRLSCNWRRMQPACGQKDCGLVRELPARLSGCCPSTSFRPRLYAMQGRIQSADYSKLDPINVFLDFLPPKLTLLRIVSGL